MMVRISGMAVAMAMLCGAAGTASARPTCGDADPSTWLRESDFKARVTSAGYRIDVFKVTPEGCYEIYGRDPRGARVEVYYDPATGEVVRSSR